MGQAGALPMIHYQMTMDEMRADGASPKPGHLWVLCREADPVDPRMATREAAAVDCPACRERLAYVSRPLVVPRGSRPWPPPAMLYKYWENSTSPLPVYVLRAGPQSQQPRGYPLGWSVNRGDLTRWDQQRGDGPHYVQRIEAGNLDALWIPTEHETETNKVH